MPESVPVSQIGSFVLYFRFHLQVMSQGVCLSLCDSLQLVWESLAVSMLPQVAAFRSFYGWVVFHCIYAPHLLYLSADRHLGFFHALAIVNSSMQWFLNGKKKKFCFGTLRRATEQRLQSRVAVLTLSCETRYVLAQVPRSRSLPLWGHKLL